MKIVSYLSSVPAKNQKQEKEELLRKFFAGAKKIGDQSILHKGSDLMSCDAALIQGWVHENSKNSPHLTLRKNVIDFQARNKNHTLVADSNLFLYANKNNPHHYLRYSFDGIFPNSANYFWDDPQPERWKKISRDSNIALKDWRTNGSHILICTQRNGGWSMKGMSVQSWLEYTVDSMRKYTDRPIIVRGHPGDRNAAQYLRNKPGKYVISSNENLVDDLRNCWAAVTYNSSPGVAAAIEGIPVFVTDLDPTFSQAKDIANFKLSEIDNPAMPERQKWVEKISMSHWNFQELESGEAWAHIRKYV